MPLLRVAKIASRMLYLDGELDTSSVGVLATVMERELRDPGPITLDLSDLTFVDSTGPHVFIRSARALDGELALLNPRPNVMRVFGIARIDAVANIVITVPEPQPPILPMPLHADGRPGPSVRA
jgi:anti-anti-sigma factor